MNKIIVSFNENCVLQAPFIITFIVTPRCLTFYYHMYGATINELQVKVISEDKTDATILWSMKYDQGSEWHFASVNVAPLHGLQVVRCTITLEASYVLQIRQKYQHKKSRGILYFADQAKIST